uniref:SRCR domain-containing protein n=1 Tax=Amphimedon queenslandica TaxID=400682 RepID=A0A1X7UEZ0_AMPQE
MGYSRHLDTGINQIKIEPAPKPGFIGWLYCSDKPISQQSILDCSYLVYEPAYSDSICSDNYNHYIAASNCTNTSVCQNGQIQLLDTNAIFLCVNGEWHALCGTSWSYTQAQVVCRQLGKNAQGAMPVNVSVPANISVLQAKFECYGYEKFLYNCSDHRSFSCDNLISQTEITVAGVTCQSLPGHPSSLTVNTQQSDIILHWEYDDANNVSNFSVYSSATPSSSNRTIPWIGGIFIGIIISAVFVIILLLIIKIVITRRSKDKQFKPNNRSSIQNDNGQNIGVYSELSQNYFEPFSNRRDPAISCTNDYESPVDVNRMTVNDDPVYSLAETEEETGNYDKLQRN